VNAGRGKPLSPIADARAITAGASRLDGRPLLVRSSRGVVPTDNGEALYHHAKFMLRQLEQAVAVARRDSTALSGRVALGLAPTTVCRNLG
jgi:DNA-binding transcriptional LysR family regulator